MQKQPPMTKTEKRKIIFSLISVLTFSLGIYILHSPQIIQTNLFGEASLKVEQKVSEEKGQKSLEIFNLSVSEPSTAILPAVGTRDYMSLNEDQQIKSLNLETPVLETKFEVDFSGPVPSLTL